MYNFGLTLNKIRNIKGISQQEMARAMIMRTALVSDMLNGTVPAPEKSYREKAYKRLELESKDIRELEEIACKEREELSPSITDYLKVNPSASEALILAESMGEGNDFWEEVRQWLLRIKETRA